MIPRRQSTHYHAVIFLLYFLPYYGSAFITPSTLTLEKLGHHLVLHTDPLQSQTQLGASSEFVQDVVIGQLSDFAPAATTLFNNMKLPAAVVTAGMISLGFATGFPVLPKDTPERQYSPIVRERCESLARLHIVLALLSVTSEIICVLWAAVEVNQLTERVFPLAASVWDLVSRDCDLAWSAVNSHFVLGIIGFVCMLTIRAYVMLLAAEASGALMTAAGTGTAAALCLMIAVVNRGVEFGGGNGLDGIHNGYGKTILDLFRHYGVLLFQCSTNLDDPGPLEFSAIVLEFTSIAYGLQVFLLGNDKMEAEEECCLNVDLDSNYAPLLQKEQEKLDICLAMEEEDKQMQNCEMETTRKDEDSSVNIL